MFKILLVDDHQMLIDGLKILLEPLCNVKVIGSANSGEEAIEKAQALTPDIILMDINMEGISGLEATAKIMEVLPETKVLMLTMHDTKEYIIRCLEVGAKGYMLKNTGREELEKAIQEVAEGKNYFTPVAMQVIMDSYFNPEKKKAEQAQVKLTKREVEVLGLITREFTNQEIADQFHLSIHTVETHRKNLISKLKVKNTVGLVKYALEQGI